VMNVTHLQLRFVSMDGSMKLCSWLHKTHSGQIRPVHNVKSDPRRSLLEVKVSIDLWRSEVTQVRFSGAFGSRNWGASNCLPAWRVATQLPTLCYTTL
jgi:hypothetical protein